MEKFTRVTKTQTYYRYDDLIKLIEEKHNIDTRDYFGMFKGGGSSYYADYWHFMIDYLSEVNAGEIVLMDWSDVRETAVEYDDEDEDERGWRTIITDFIIAEVGSGPEDFLMYDD